MLAYDATKHDKEPCGGILWTFKKMWNGTIYEEEGVWLHARLVASNVSQYFIVRKLPTCFMRLFPFVLLTALVNHQAILYLVAFVLIYRDVYSSEGGRRLEDFVDDITPEQWQ